MKKQLTKILALLVSAALIAVLFAACTTTQPTEKETAPATREQTKNETKATETEAPTEPETTEPAPTEPVVKVVADHAGNEVTIPDTIERIVVCDIYPLPSILTVFFDSASKLVGIAGPSMSAAKSSLLSELYPEILNASTSFINGTTVNIEELMNLRPDIVFYNAGNKTLGEELRNAGITAFGMSAGKWKYDALETLDQWIQTFEEIFPSNGKAEIVRKYGEEMQKLVSERIAGLETKSTVLFLFQYTDSQILLNGNPSFGSWWSDAVGLTNLIQDKTEANSLPVSMEQIYAMDPDILFVTNFTTASAEDIYENKVGTYDWSPVKAVKDGRVYKMPLGMYRSYTSGVDSPVCLLWLAKAAYPELFEDIDITTYTKQYYKAVFGIELTDDQANSIFSPDAAAGKMN